MLPRKRRDSIARAAQAASQVARRNVMLFARLAEVGVIVQVTPTLIVELSEGGKQESASEPLYVGEDGITLGLNVRKYDQEHQLKIGDSLAMVQIAAEDFLAVDVITDKEVARGPHTWVEPSDNWVLDAPADGGVVGWPSQQVIGKIRVFDEDGVVIGWMPVFNHLPGSEPPWPPTS